MRVVVEELREAAVPVLAGVAGAHQCDEVVHEVLVGGPDLRAVDDPAAVDLYALGAHGGEVGARLRLAHADAEEARAGADAGEDVALGALAAMAQDLRPRLPVGDPMRTTGSAGGEHLGGDDEAREARQALPAVLTRPGHADEAGCACAGAEGGIERRPRRAVRGKAPLRLLVSQERAHAPARVLGLGWQRH